MGIVRWSWTGEMLAPLVNDQQELEDEASVDGSHAQDPANPRSVPIFTGFVYINVYFVMTK